MQKTLYYLPLEPYVERYTYLMSSKEGWAEHHFKHLGVNFVRIDGDTLGNTIKTGFVLDAHGRSYFALSQIMKVVRLLANGVIKDGDIIYVEDFWHPGIESLFYIRHLSGVKFKVGTFLHAQSVDDTDFSYSMREWIRPIEQGFGKGYDYIFVTSAILQKLCIDNGIGNEHKVINVGLPYNSVRLLEQLGDMGFKMPEEKEPYVIFSSRFDDEKDPMFFLDLVERCKDIQFKLVKPRAVLSHNPEVMARIEKILATQSNLELVDTSNKLTYYETLAKAKVQFNCAHQDWVSWTLLEAVTFKCNPLYPVWKDFPVELHNDARYLYEKRNLDECEQKLRALMQMPFNEELNYVVEKHDASWYYYLRNMNYWEVEDEQI